MDLMGDIGLADQLVSAREENKVLSAMTKELQEKVKELNIDNHALRIENQSLLAELEEYRKEAALPSFSKLALGKGVGESKDGSETSVTEDDFIRSGNGIFPSDAAATLLELHGTSNPLCCALHPDDLLMVTGGADKMLCLFQWGLALAPGDAAAETVKNAARVMCPGPVISAAFATQNKGKSLSLLAAGCMDGSVCLVGYDSRPTVKLHLLTTMTTHGVAETIKHPRYVKCISWSPSAPILATASADGTVKVIKILSSAWSSDDTIISNSMDDSMDVSDESKLSDETRLTFETLCTLHLPGAVEAMTFLDNGSTLVCHARGTSYLSYFDLNDNFKQTKYSVNGDVTGGYDEHVSFTIMALVPSPNDGGKYLAAATDTSRNIIFASGSARQVRNLYGHQNDGYSQPKIAWSSNGQYLLGNTQDESSICVWDIASASIVKRLNDTCNGHSGTIRDMFSSAFSDTVVTVSYDKSAKVWLNSM